MTSEADESERPESITHAAEVAEEQRQEMERDVEFAATERMIFFSDAVVAIALTLLALDLPTPTGTSVSELLDGLRSDFGSYLAFVISFAVISTHWRTHHRVFRYVRRVPQPVLMLNMAWLFLIVITPWSTKLLGTDRINLLRFGQYAAIQTLQQGLMAVMITLLIREDLVRPGTDLGKLRAALQRIIPVMLGFGLSIPAYLLVDRLRLSPYWSYASWALLPTVLGYGNRIREHLRRPTRRS